VVKIPIVSILLLLDVGDGESGEFDLVGNRRDKIERDDEGIVVGGSEKLFKR